MLKSEFLGTLQIELGVSHFSGEAPVDFVLDS
jgi:hypothetical protein